VTGEAWTIDAPGQWSLDLTHVPPGSTALVQELMRATFPAGMKRMFADLGAPLESMDLRFVNGHMYTRLRPLVGADRAGGKAPPKAVLKLVTRVHPAFRRRERTARRSLTEEPWRAVVAEWHAGGRAAVERANLELQEVDLAALDDAAVARHARACMDRCLVSWEQHFWLHGYDLGPLGQYLYEGQAWGLGPAELLPLLEGASPSTSEPRRLLSEIRRMVDESGASPTSLDDVRAISPEAAAALDGYLRYRGAQLFSRYDVDGLTLGECPDLILASIDAAAAGDSAARVTERSAAVRQRVPAAQRDRFDDVLRQARDAMDLRDDNGPNTAEWPLGLLRLALLELGRRMVAAGVADAPDQALELTTAELTPALFTGAAPGAAALADRTRRRAEQRTLQPPRTIGPAEAPPPPGVLPPYLDRLTGMIQVVVQQMAMGPEALAAASGLHGAGVGDRAMRGTARVASSPEEALDKLEPGDVLVVVSTTPAYNLVLSIAGGVVTSEGGPLSHAAVLARELGIPAVVGAADAMGIADGAEVEVDPVAGEVRLIPSM